MKKILTLLIALACCHGVMACDACTNTASSSPGKPACCAEEKPAAPITARSVYQLDATWTNDAGQPVQLASLRGQPVVLAMFFARCEYACPLLVADLHRVRDALPAGVRAKTRFVLLSFDSERDTPSALKAYRQGRSLDESWVLLRADAAAVQELAMVLGIKFKRDERGQFSHSNVITVLNAEGEIAFQRNGLKGDPQEPARAIVAVAVK